MILLDTHVWAWSIYAPERISATALALISETEARFASSVTLYEVALKVRLGKWPEMSEYQEQALPTIQDQGIALIDMTGDIALEAGRTGWPHRDPFDRMIAATALHMKLLLISADTTFDSHPDRRLRRIW